MLTIHTDLAAEAHQLWRESAGQTTRLEGVLARDEELCGFPVTRVEILDEEGERALGKPRGIYLSPPSGCGRRGPSSGRPRPWPTCWSRCCRRRGPSWWRAWATPP